MMFGFRSWLLGPVVSTTLMIFVKALLATASSFSSKAVRDTAYEWASIPSSNSLQWKTCFGIFTCTKLQVPLDYGNPARGNTSIAILKYAAQNETAETQNIVINIGGPGGINTDFVVENAEVVSEMMGSQHNIVGLDPRGVGYSGPTVDCWPGHAERRAQFEKLYYPYISNSSSTALDYQFYTAAIFGKACTLTVGGSDGNASFMSTPAVARDLLSYITAEQIAARRPEEDAKLSYCGMSYGTVLATTFASMFPNNVGRIIADGVLDAADYYDLGWKKNLQESDKALNKFHQYCYQAGPRNCSFWGPSIDNISDRFQTVFEKLKYSPMPIPASELCHIPFLATYSDLKQYTLQAMYDSLANFPALADVLSGLEAGNTTNYMQAVTSGTIPANPCNDGSSGSTVDANTLIKCVDGYGGHKFENVGEYRAFVETLTRESTFFGEVWPNNANTVACRAFTVEVPERGKLHGSIMAARNTSFPILFVASEIDPVTPKYNAYKMASVFPGSVVLKQNSVGHTATASPSSCLIQHFRAYLAGQLPSPNTTCQAEMLPFQGTGISFR
ncbi:Putative hydrolase Mb2248c [Talaromyces islandicus]|uniref:Putative hydrolase Mb2248c n=1 Tax=Talaromyces islandicus TaxID=28573 RepID=A0A0U1LZD5_TALIS|nr:Putative hydrolase Mb2248c [Talaromyces islandicus]